MHLESKVEVTSTKVLDFASKVTTVFELPPFATGWGWFVETVINQLKSAWNAIAKIDGNRLIVTLDAKTVKAGKPEPRTEQQLVEFYHRHKVVY